MAETEAETVTSSAAADLSADIAEAWRRYEPSLARIPRKWPMAAEPAHVFDPRAFAPAPERREDG